MSIVPTNVPYNSLILRRNISVLLRTYPFLNSQIVGNSVLGRPLPVIKLGKRFKKSILFRFFPCKRMDYKCFINEIY